MAGTDKSKLVSVNIWLKDISQFDQMNATWELWVDPSALPARDVCARDDGPRDSRWEPDAADEGASRIEVHTVTRQ